MHRNGQRPAALGDGRSPHPETLAAPLGFIHTNNSPNPILALLSGRFEARVSVGKGGRMQPDACRIAAWPPATWVAWCVT
jgi:hypothetical protein